MGTAYLVLVLILCHYCLAFNPRRRLTAIQQVGSEPVEDKNYDNPLDVALIGLFEGLGPRYTRRVIPRERLESVFQEVRLHTS